MQVIGDLLHWFDRNRRSLPWRELGTPPDPYAVWISEIMLQQTRVETVVPYYIRFMRRFPDVASLAGATEAEVLALWSGLGYYRRGRALLAAAREVVAAGGAFPRSARELERLPGIGPYTAAAIASIAFAEPVAVLDGNVARVAARFAASRATATSAAGRAALLEVATGWLDPRRPGDSNQAMMELGATVCLPRSPRCALCPLASGCRALALGAVEEFPTRPARAEIVRTRQLAAFVERGDELLLFRRSAASGQLGGLWEFPLVELGGESSPEAALAAAYGGAWSLGEELARVRHAITTRAFTIEVRRAAFVPAAVESGLVCERGEGDARGAAEDEPGWWDRPAALALPLTGLARKLLARPEIQPE